LLILEYNLRITKQVGSKPKKMGTIIEDRIMNYAIVLTTLLAFAVLGLFGGGYFFGRFVHDPRSRSNEVFLVLLYLLSSVISGAAVLYFLLFL
jgi:hypothetical protein